MNRTVSMIVRGLTAMGTHFPAFYLAYSMITKGDDFT